MLFTDGLSERRNPGDETSGRIRTRSMSAGAPARDIAEGLQAAALRAADEADDDVAPLVLGGAPSRMTWLRSPASPVQRRRAERSTRSWSRGRSAARVREALGAAPEARRRHHTDIELVMTELVTNSVRHGRLREGETIRVTGAVSDGVLARRGQRLRAGLRFRGRHVPQVTRPAVGTG